MGIKDLFAKLSGTAAPKLADLHGEVQALEVHTLSVHTAEQLVIVEIPTTAASWVKETLGRRCIAKLAVPAMEPGDDLYLIPTKDKAIAVRDPKRGWLIPVPLTDVEKLEHTPGDYELNEHLAIVLN